MGKKLTLASSVVPWSLALAGVPLPAAIMGGISTVAGSSPLRVGDGSRVQRCWRCEGALGLQGWRCLSWLFTIEDVVGV